MKLRTLPYIAGVCTALAVPLVAEATPVVLGPGQTHVFNFDASALGSYAKVGFGLTFDEFDGEIQGGSVSVYSGHDNTGVLRQSCSAGFDFGLYCVPSLDLSIFTGYLLLEGDFSLVITSQNGTFSIDPYAKIYQNANDTTFTRLDPVAPATVAEPSSLALLGLALAGAAMSRRRKG